MGGFLFWHPPLERLNVDLIHLRHNDFAGSVQLTGLCRAPDGAFFASGYTGPPPHLGSLLKIETSGKRMRVGRGLHISHSVAFDSTTGTLLTSANDGTTPNRPSAPNGIYRVQLDGSCSVVTRDITGSGPCPVATDAGGNLYHPAVLPDTEGYSVVRRNPNGTVTCIASSFRQIAGIATDDDGNVFVADAELTLDEGAIFRISRDGKVSVLVCDDGIRPHAVAAGKGNCFFSNIRGSNSDICEIYRCEPDGHVSLIADGLIQSRGLVYDAENDVVYALDFLNFEQGASTIPAEFHNDTLILRIAGEGEHVPAPFHQDSSDLPVVTARKPTVLSSCGSNVITPETGCGPERLLPDLIATKQRLERSGFVHGLFLSDQAVERLLRLAYFASLQEEEGRYPRLRILAGTNWDSRHRVHFGPFPKYLSEAKELRKLAPAAAFRGSAIVFDEEWSGGQHARLVCRGIYDSEELMSTNISAFNSIEDAMILKAPILAIRVEGPGYLKAALLPGPVYSLRGGIFRPLSTVESVPCVQELFKEIGQWQHRHLPDGDDKRVRAFFGSPDVLGRVMARMWSRVLWHVSDRRRGGTFVILPREKGHWRHADSFDIAVSHRAQFNYGRAVIDGVLSCLQNTPASGKGYGDYFRLTWERSRGERERLTRMLADLANVDGCVVLDRRLNVIGFGGKIRIGVTQLEGFGARHGSASAWCSRHPGGIAFVVSQDGDVRVLSHDSFDAVDAGTSILEFC